MRQFSNKECLRTYGYTFVVNEGHIHAYRFPLVLKSDTISNRVVNFDSARILDRFGGYSV